MQNLTFGADGGLTEACREAYPEDKVRGGVRVRFKVEIRVRVRVSG